LRDYLCNDVITENKCEDFSQWFFTGEEEEEEDEEGKEEEGQGGSEQVDVHDEL